MGPTYGFAPGPPFARSITEWVSNNSKLNIFLLKNTWIKPILFGNCRKFPTKITHSKYAHNVGTPSRIKSF